MIHKELHYLTEFGFLLSALIMYIWNIKYLYPITLLFYILYVLSTTMQIYIHISKGLSIKSALKQYASDIFTIAAPAFAACIIAIQKILN